MTQTTFKLETGNNRKERGIFLSFNGPSILAKRTREEVITFVINRVNKDFKQSNINHEIKFDINEAHRQALSDFFDLSLEVREFLALDSIWIKNKLIIKPNNMFTTLLLYGFLVNPNILNYCTMAIVEGYGTFRYVDGRVSFAPETTPKEITINTKIPKL